MSACQRTVKDKTQTTEQTVGENSEESIDKDIESTWNDASEESPDMGEEITAEAGTIAEIGTNTEAETITEIETTVETGTVTEIETTTETTTETVVREVTGGVVEAKQVYTVSQYELENIARDFFMEQAKQTIECGNIDTLEPKSINTMKKKANLNIVSDWDENEFLGLQQTFKIMRNAMVMGSVGETISYNVSVPNVMNNFNGTYRYYEDSDAILMMAVSLSANSSIQHNSNKTGSGSGYVLLKFKLNKYDSSNKDWELYGIYGYKSSNHKSYEDQADIIRNANWEDYMLKNEDES